MPAKTYLALRDSTTSIDVVFFQGKGGSLSIDQRNVKIFNSFFENAPAQKTNTPQAGTIMWQIQGREFLSASFYLGDSTGYIVSQKEGKEYVTRINPQGNSFLKNQIKH
jgi:hypothetical protein